MKVKKQLSQLTWSCKNWWIKCGNFDLPIHEIISTFIAQCFVSYHTVSDVDIELVHERQWNVPTFFIPTKMFHFFFCAFD